MLGDEGDNGRPWRSRGKGNVENNRGHVPRGTYFNASILPNMLEIYAVTSTATTIRFPFLGWVSYEIFKPFLALQTLHYGKKLCPKPRRGTSLVFLSNGQNSKLT